MSETRRQWYRGKGADRAEIIETANDGRPDRDVLEIKYGTWSRAEQDQHANLAAAAPDLLEAAELVLEELSRMMNGPFDESRYMERIRVTHALERAIRRAKGE